MTDKRPYVVVEWNDTETEAKGWLCAFNFVRNYCGGGTRMHPSVTREEVIRLATTMGYKYKAIESETTGGCKGGIAYDYKAPDALDVLRRYLTAMAPYIKAGVSIGGDLGVDYGDVLDILNDLGIGLPQTKAMEKDPEIQQGIQNHDAACGLTYDGFKMYDMITGYGVAFAADEAWNFKNGKPGASVVVQGFGAVGASCAYCLDKMGYKVVGLADVNGLVYCKDGLDVKKLVETKKPKGEMDPTVFAPEYEVLPNSKWVEMPCDILIPAALEDVINKSNADRVQASLIVEAANIPTTAEADEILHKRGVDVVVDFVANTGGVRIYEALVFRIVKDPVPQDIVDDTERIVRKQTRRLFEEADKTGRYTREIARQIFAPDTFDTPDI
ncbi:MAG TPA: Glu/Leu/Phe/Val dehydrogenase dimerization domain-containing protein [Anaerovoracaceae bacterium]|nr:Glu/Leu/Phe/Val dehydrogenase dimerization domain-containing protein [Bacillota bacterium]HRV32736.1 Glu/Leu/Phe/Val dehydrogenase dimerization domain-containing protein [Anaerovoracaceae bacterium]